MIESNADQFIFRVDLKFWIGVPKSDFMSKWVEERAIVTKYAIVSAAPKNAESHLNSKFKIYEKDAPDSWTKIGWKSIHDISDLIRNGHEVFTGKIVKSEPGSKNSYLMSLGAKVEMVLRISKDETNYKISEMPDK